MLVKWLKYLLERFSLPLFLPSAFLHTAFLLYYTAGPDILKDVTKLLVGVFTYLGVFLILRFSDELKDKSHDDSYYPDRPIQRGLLSLSEIKKALLITIFVTVMINFAEFSIPLFVVLFALALYMTLMRYEFFASGFVRSNIIIYMVTHQLFVPIFFCYYFVIVGRWPLIGNDILFILANLLMLMSVEVARKIRPRNMENASKDTYSAALGRGFASIFLLILLLTSVLIFIKISILPNYALSFLTLPLISVFIYYFTDKKFAAKSIMITTTLIIALWMLIVIL